MLTSDITLNTRVYALSSQRTNGSLRRQTTRQVSEPRSLTISHETANSGRISSAVIMDDVKVVPFGTTSSVADTVRVMVKIQYNPLSGRTGIDTIVKELITDLTALLSAGNVDKLLNKES